jgi:hypothetical protein
LHWAVSAAAFALAPPLLGGAAEPPGAPALEVVLRPHVTGSGDSYIDVRMTLRSPDVAAGQILVHMPLKIVGIPTARYDGNAISASDAQGPLALTAEDEPPTPQWIYRDWKISRATAGDVVLTYRAPPRHVTAATNNGPLFDLREEAGGFVGAGIGILALPTREGPWRIDLKWDLSEAPAGSRGVWSLGEGDVTVTVPAETLGYSYYMVGPLNSIPARDDGKFGLYWLGEPPFDVSALGQRIRALYTTMASFFHDSDSSYRVFMRQNPFEGTGGTGLARSFMFGYNPPAKPTVDALQGLLAHEIAHNWPAMQGEHADTAWYSEGTAEYYSLLLSSRAGLLSPGQFLSSINEKARAYYQNPYLTLTNPQAAKLFWTDPAAQTVPYGRGFIYLQLTDGAIRAKSGGKRSLDDVVLELYRRKVQDQPYGIPQWLDLVGREIGAREARRAYDDMVAGTVEAPDTHRFAPCFKVVRQSTRKFDLGFARSSLNDDRIVRDLIAGSAAARAGLQNGDTVVTVSGMLEATKDESKPINLTFRQAGVERSISYLPRGEAVQGYAWVRDPRAADSACRF